MITARELRAHFGRRRPPSRRSGVVWGTTPPVSHYLRFDEPVNGGLVRAVCGTLVRQAEHDHVREPSCPDCQAVMAEADALEL